MGRVCSKRLMSLHVEEGWMDVQYYRLRTNGLGSLPRDEEWIGTGFSVILWQKARYEESHKSAIPI